MTGNESTSVLSRVDLNLLPPLAALLTERHVTRAATAVGVSQSAMSHALRRLRRLLDDELLISTKAGYRLTPRAERLRLELAELVPQLDALFAGERFDPATTARTFRVAGNDYGLTVLDNALYGRLLSAAPRSLLKILPWHGWAADQLGRADLDLVVVGGAPPASLSCERLFTDRFVCVVSREHPMAGRDAISLDEYLDCGHLVVDVDGGAQPSVDGVLAERGTPRQAVLTLPAHANLPLALVGTELVLTIPAKLVDAHVAPHVRAGMLSVFAAPDVIRTMDFHMVWHPRTDDDPAHVWLRGHFRNASRPVEKG